ncbi:hypothetical protein PR048_007071 [Dryococelus australis]|uniref:Uncharacterized protein n=1 Tax=Dryococelus australis TaxID=614101 RepID=A0ABQ9ICM4_9NEOP|nr:hypothetical protein PR048_007071 [Dryococelus australis]
MLAEWNGTASDLGRPPPELVTHWPACHATPPPPPPQCWLATVSPRRRILLKMEGMASRSSYPRLSPGRTASGPADSPPWIAPGSPARGVVLEEESCPPSSTMVDVGPKRENVAGAMTELPGFLAPSAGSLRTLPEVTAVGVDVRVCIIHWRGEILAGINIEALRADKSEVRCQWISAEEEGWGEWEIPEKTRWLTTSSGTITTCKNPGLTRPGIEPGLPWWEASSLTSQRISKYYSTSQCWAGSTLNTPSSLLGPRRSSASSLRMRTPPRCKTTLSYNQRAESPATLDGRTCNKRTVPPQFNPGQTSPQCSGVLRTSSRTLAFTRQVSHPIVHSHYKHLIRRRLAISSSRPSLSPMSLAAPRFPEYSCSFSQDVGFFRRGGGGVGTVTQVRSAVNNSPRCRPPGADRLWREEGLVGSQPYSTFTKLQPREFASGRGMERRDLGGALNIEVLRCDEDEGPECKVARNERSTKKTKKKKKTPPASGIVGTIPTCQNPGATPPGIEPGITSVRGEQSNHNFTAVPYKREGTIHDFHDDEDVSLHAIKDVTNGVQRNEPWKQRVRCLSSRKRRLENVPASPLYSHCSSDLPTFICCLCRAADDKRRALVDSRLYALSGSVGGGGDHNPPQPSGRPTHCPIARSERGRMIDSGGDLDGVTAPPPPPPPAGEGDEFRGCARIFWEYGPSAQRAALGSAVLIASAFWLSAVTGRSRRGSSVKKTDDDGRLQEDGGRGVCGVNGRQGLMASIVLGHWRSHQQLGLAGDMLARGAARPRRPSPPVMATFTRGKDNEAGVATI